MQGGRVNRELLVKLVNDLREAVEEARPLVSKPFNELSLYERLAIRYLVIELVEAAAAACVHLLRRLRGVESEGYPQCFIRLGRSGLVPEALAERLAAAARLRNLLVHRYRVRDDERLYEAARRGLRDFEEYAEIIREIAEKFGEEEG